MEKTKFNSQPLISVIIPVYNVKKYLMECFDSIQHQTYSNIEIILIDDGSTDGSSEICDELKNSDSRVKVIHKENAGLGFARNSGLELAIGKYVCFIDSDDFVTSDYIQKLYVAIESSEATVAYCGYYDYYSEKNFKKNERYYDNVVFEGNEIGKVLAGMIGAPPEEKKIAYQSMSACFSLYRMKIIKENNLHFYSERELASEDILFNVEYLVHAKKVVCISDALYFYRHTVPSSLTHSFSINKFEVYKKLLRKLAIMEKQYFEYQNIDLPMQRLYLGTLRSNVRNAVNYKKISRDFNLRKYVKELISSSDTREVIKNYPYQKNPKLQRIFNQCIKYEQVSLIILLMKLDLWKKSKEAQ
ncbi:MAG: glycosyltransferase [Streptococcaceae bacterium]|jgi:glycosyltransferase involved in cell wall biosynthesis|nr:glycosyltransferase [Streptococcaceae bacterium]